MNRILHIIKKAVTCDKIYFILALLKRRNIKPPRILKFFARRKVSKKQKLFQEIKGFKLLDIKTPDNFNQCVHPDLIKLADADYLLALTPYPFGNDKYERPTIYRSSDKLMWKYIAGPIASEQEGKKNHLSDPTLVKLDTGDIQCYYRECIYNQEIPLTNIYRMTSENGYLWKNKECVVSEPMDKFDIISPSVKSDERGVHAYFCLKQNKEIKLMYTKNQLFEVEGCSEVDLSNCIPEGKMLWHVSHICNGKNDILLLTLSDDFGESNSELYMGVIDNRSLTVKGINKIRIKEMVPDILIEYRATGIVENNKIIIIVSVMFKDRIWGCIEFETGGIGI